MNTKEEKKMQKQERSTVSISVEMLQSLNDYVKELNVHYQKFEEYQEGTRLKKPKGIAPITVKTFTEAALRYFIYHKIDPRFYEDGSIGNQINRLRNHILGFIVKQENTLLKPLSMELSNLKGQLSTLQGIAQKDDLLVLKNKLEDGHLDQELATLETNAILMGLLQVLFDMMEVSEPERKRLELLLQKKGGEYVEKQTAS